ELEGIECLVVRDFYHRYTVDEHTLVAIQNLWGLRGAEEAPLKSYGDLLAEMQQPAALAFALLFHDAGKGRGGEHVAASLRLAEQLWQLYLMVYNELTRELEAERIDIDPAGPPERVEFLRGFPTRYLRTHTEAEIDEHIALEEKSHKRGVAVDIRKLDSAYQ